MKYSLLYLCLHLVYWSNKYVRAYVLLPVAFSYLLVKSIGADRQFHTHAYGTYLFCSTYIGQSRYVSIDITFHMPIPRKKGSVLYKFLWTYHTGQINRSRWTISHTTYSYSLVYEPILLMNNSLLSIVSISGIDTFHIYTYPKTIAYEYFIYGSM